jgi:3-isopropylmalate/(R)-2-methylmalate dehydratase large subunit
MAKTLFDKIWDSHVITDLGNGFVLLHIDRLLLHDLSGARALQEAVDKGYTPAQPRLVYGTPDHAISTAPGRTEKTFPPGEPLIRNMRAATAKYGIRLFDLGQDGNGIVHIIGPELALTLPGATLICGDSHTCTHGGMGALAFGVGSSELVHALATQTMVQRKPKRFRVHFEGKIPEGVTPKDMILHLIGDVGTAAGTGHAVEYAGSAIRSLPVEGRLTICNLSIEMGARTGMVAPDDITFEYLAGRALAHAALRSRCRLRSRAHDRHEQGGAADHLGHQPRARHRRRQSGSGSDDRAGGETRGLDGGSAVSGARAR